MTIYFHVYTLRGITFHPKGRTKSKSNVIAVFAGSRLESLSGWLKVVALVVLLVVEEEGKEPTRCASNHRSFYQGLWSGLVELGFN